MKNIDLSNKELLIFDWDGTLVDSRGTYAEADRILVDRLFGVKLPEGYYYERRKRDKNQNTTDYYQGIYREFNQFSDLDISIDAIMRKVAAIRTQQKMNIKYRAGAVATLEKIRKNTNAPIILATNSSFNDINFLSNPHSCVGKILPPIDFFDKIITYEDVTDHKPSPAIFLKAINHYGVRAEDTLIFEDSLPGVIAGKISGAKVAVIYSKYSQHNNEKIRQNSDFYFADWIEILNSLK